MPLRLKLGSEILIVYLYLKSNSMTLNKHSIVKVVPTVIKLLVNIVSLLGGEINCSLTWISEILYPQSFTFNLR
ncbi:hypothetical protein FPN187_contig00063-0006 [Flavobacterium psychrophilum]|nr:hypothetical protein FPN186_contig00079-0006 [Flavobacterium psychrophilum]GEJ32453.1 hypothetical protein FPN181_contig00064-0009 [Flavobacterium psychrophilum]GEJ32996.1 hypothetical protein FPN185_contig00065-0009 [Flavobacterium psychrophilum]GEJ39727.1 hypothetical protein FPN187_contig00063-0006 [Flavobacterium psychrophilum]GEJ42453.1 hypothetical protein FPN182_contig00071-0009 [Flavobacterium psychrophilum]